MLSFDFMRLSPIHSFIYSSNIVRNSCKYISEEKKSKLYAIVYCNIIGIIKEKKQSRGVRQEYVGRVGNGVGQGDEASRNLKRELMLRDQDEVKWKSRGRKAVRNLAYSRDWVKLEKHELGE